MKCKYYIGRGLSILQGAPSRRVWAADKLAYLNEWYSDRKTLEQREHLPTGLEPIPIHVHAANESRTWLSCYVELRNAHLCTWLIGVLKASVVVCVSVFGVRYKASHFKIQSKTFSPKRSHHHHPSLYKSHCWTQDSSQDKMAWAVVSTRVQLGLETSQELSSRCFLRSESKRNT